MIRRFMEWRGWHELAHARYEGSTRHSRGVCKGRCTLDPLGLPRRDTSDWEVPPHQQRKLLFAYGYFVALVREKSTNQDCF